MGRTERVARGVVGTLDFFFFFAIKRGESCCDEEER